MRAALTLVLGLAAASASAQSLTVVADKPAYGRGEPIGLNVEIVGPEFGQMVVAFGQDLALRLDGRTLRWPGLGVQVGSGGPLVLNGRSRAGFGLRLDPALTGLAAYEGGHTAHVELRAWLVDGPLVTLRDSVRFDAPAARGGLLSVGFDSVQAGAVRRVRDSLGAVLVAPAACGGIVVPDTSRAEAAQVKELWQLRDATVPEVAARLAPDARFRYVRVGALVNGCALVVTSRAPSPSPLHGLEGPWPQPFDASATLRFANPAAGPVRAEAFDALGRRVATLFDGPAPPGPLTLRVEGAALAPGLYLVRVSTPQGTTTARLLRR